LDWQNYKGEIGLTKSGSMLGTVSYMSPEQATNEQVDHRSDIWSFGVLLYEMITGELPFEGKHEAGILYSIVHSESPKIQNADCPEGLGFIVQKALMKNPDERYQNMSEVLNDLRTIERGNVLSKPHIKKTSHKTLIFKTTLIAACTIALVIFFLNSKQDNKLPPIRTVRLTSYPGGEYNPVLSPDGKFVAFSWNGSKRDNFDVYVKNVSGGEPVRLTTNKLPEGSPQWSTDGGYIAFVRNLADQYYPNFEMYVVPSLGGKEQKIVKYFPGPFPADISWSSDNKHIYFHQWSNQDSGLTISRVSIETHEIEIMTHLPENSFADFSPWESPDGKYLAFKRRKLAGLFDLFVKNLESNVVQQVTDVDTRIEGFFWGKENRSIVFSANLDGTAGLWKTDLSGSKPVKVLSGISISNPDYSSTANTLVYNEATAASNIWKTDLQNPEKEVAFIESSFRNNNPDISSDGKKILFSSNRTGTQNIWVCESDGTNPTQLTFFEKKTKPGYAKWSPLNNEILVNFSGKNIDLINISGGTSRTIALGDYPSWALNGQGFYASTFIPDLKLYLFSRDGKVLKQITKGTGMNAQPYGDYIYYIKHYEQPDIWRVSVDGTNEEPVIQGFDIGRKAWDVKSNGIYFKRYNNGKPLICFYDFESRKIRVIKEVSFGYGSIAVDPDERYLLYSKSEPSQSDVVMVENFQLD
jgi:Tol biopolymer transport system component